MTPTGSSWSPLQIIFHLLFHFCFHFLQNHHCHPLCWIHLALGVVSHPLGRNHLAVRLGDGGGLGHPPGGNHLVSASGRKASCTR